MEKFGLTPFTFALAIIIGIIVSFTIIALTAPTGEDQPIPTTIHQQSPVPQATIPPPDPLSDNNNPFELFVLFTEMIFIVSVLCTVFAVLQCSFVDG